MEDIIKLTAAAGSVVVGVVGAWLHARFSRKVRLKIGRCGEIETEAQTVAGVKSLLKEAEGFQQRNQRKVIHEPWN